MGAVRAAGERVLEGFGLVVAEQDVRSGVQVREQRTGDGHHRVGRGPERLGHVLDRDLRRVAEHRLEQLFGEGVVRVQDELPPRRGDARVAETERGLVVGEVGVPEGLLQLERRRGHDVILAWRVAAMSSGTPW